MENRITFNTIVKKEKKITMCVFKQQGPYKNQITYNSWTAHRTYILYIISAKKETEEAIIINQCSMRSIFGNK